MCLTGVTTGNVPRLYKVSPKGQRSGYLRTPGSLPSRGPGLGQAPPRGHCDPAKHVRAKRTWHGAWHGAVRVVSGPALFREQRPPLLRAAAPTSARASYGASLPGPGSRSPNLLRSRATRSWSRHSHCFVSVFNFERRLNIQKSKDAIT